MVNSGGDWKRVPHSTYALVGRSQDRDEMYSMRIAFDGWTAHVKGYEILAAAANGVHHLLICGDGELFENGFNIHLIDCKGIVQESLEIFIPYHRGQLGRFRVHPAGVVEFCFYGEEEWRVTVFPKPGWRIPKLLDPPWLGRDWRLRSFLRVVLC